MRHSRIACALVTALTGFFSASAANAQQRLDCPASTRMPQGAAQSRDFVFSLSVRAFPRPESR